MLSKYVSHRLALLLLFIGFASSVHAAPFKNVWSADGIAALSSSSVNLTDKNKNLVGTLPISTVRELIEIKNRITREAGVSAELFIVDGDSPNAFATRLNEKNVIGFNIPMLKQFGGDPNAIAAVMGHEIAHLTRSHGQAQQSFDAVAGVVGLLAGLAMDRNLSKKYGASNLGQNLGSLGSTLASRSFSRDQEREADDVGLRYMRTANYDPNGAVRLWQSMPGGNSSFFSTHPPTPERISNIRSIIATLAPWQPSPTLASVKPVEVSSKPSTNVEYKEDTSSPDDPFILSLQAQRAGKHEDARRFALTSAEAGDPRGQIAVGYYYFIGQGGVERDYKKAAEQLELAEQQGSAMATNVLGMMRENGFGFARDPAQAAEYYKRAADAGYPDGKARLAGLKFRGLGVEKDYAGAFELASSAAGENSKLGSYILGLLYFNGFAVQKDVAKARELFESAASRGHPASDAFLGNMYSSGTGVAQNLELAVSYFTRAAEKNDVGAKASLGFMYLAGRGVPRDAVKARTLFEDAHKHGNSLGTLGLGHLYRTGLTVQKDEIQSLAYYEIGAQKGLAAATKARDDLAAKMSVQDVERARSRVQSLISTSRP